MEFSINNLVRIKLTDHGRNIVSQQEFPHPYKEDEDGWSEWQLWVAMNVFGSYLGNGLEIPFETTIDMIKNY
jgi:hypothetical protein